MKHFLKKGLIWIFWMSGALALLALVAALCLLISNNSVACSSYDIVSKKIPVDFDGYKIGLVTDFHNGGNYEKVLKQMKKQTPDMIAVVGDSINSKETTFENTKLLLSGLTEIAPTYLVSGNHEQWADREVYSSFLDFATRTGVVCLDNQAIVLKHKNAVVNLVGAQDEIYSDDKLGNYTDVIKGHLDQLYKKIDDTELFTILLFHRGNLVEMPAQYGYDLILSGHLHGGIVNLPYFRDKILESHADSTKYCKGKYLVENSRVIISGGLESKKGEIRVFNPPEIVIVNLYKQL